MIVIRRLTTSIVLAALLIYSGPPSAMAQNARLIPRIFVADMDGNNVKLLVEIPGAAYHGSLHWGSSGKVILINATPRHAIGRMTSREFTPAPLAAHSAATWPIGAMAAAPASRPT
jgi:hypothetical protein